MQTLKSSYSQTLVPSSSLIDSAAGINYLLLLPLSAPQLSSTFCRADSMNSFTADIYATCTAVLLLLLLLPLLYNPISDAYSSATSTNDTVDTSASATDTNFSATSTSVLFLLRHLYFYTSIPLLLLLTPFFCCYFCNPVYVCCDSLCAVHLQCVSTSIMRAAPLQ